MKKSLFLVLILTLLIGGIPAYGASVPGTYYQLDTGVVFLWQEPDGAWQYGLAPGTNTTSDYSLNIAGSNDPATIKNVTVVPYKNDFSFANTQNFSWNSNRYATDQLGYNTEYFYGKSINLTSAIPDYDPKTGNLKVIWNGGIPANVDDTFDVKNLLIQGLSSEVYERMGVTRDSASANIRERIEEFDPLAGASSSVRSFMFFVPTVIKYDVVPRLKAHFKGNTIQNSVASIRLVSK